MSTSATQVEPTIADEFVGPVPIQIRKGFAQKEQVMSWPGFVKLMSGPTWIGEQRLAEFARAAEWDCDDLADLAEAFGDLAPAVDPGSVEAGEWRPMPWSASLGRRDLEDGSYSVIACDVAAGRSLEEVIAYMAGLRAIVHSTFLHTPDLPLWRVIVAAEPALSDREVLALRKRFFGLRGLGANSARGDDERAITRWHRLPACPSDARSTYTAIHIKGRPINAMDWLGRSIQAAPIEWLARPDEGTQKSASASSESKPTNIDETSALTPSTEQEERASGERSTPVHREAHPRPKAPPESDPSVGADARTALTALAAEYKASGDYASIRSRYMALNLHLNEERAWAPAFRPRPVIPKMKSSHLPKHMEIHQDQVVIDCHWLRCIGSPVYPRDEAYQPLFDAETPFSEALARSFAEQPWSKVHRTDDALALTLFQQAQLGTLESTEIMTRRRHALRGTGAGATRISARMSTFRRCMNRWCESDPRMRQHRDMYEALWLARELLGDEARADHLAQLAALKIGGGAAPLTAGTVREKLRKLDRKLASVGFA